MLSVSYVNTGQEYESHAVCTDLVVEMLVINTSSASNTLKAVSWLDIMPTECKGSDATAD